MIEGLSKEKYESEFIFLGRAIPEIYKRLNTKGFKVKFIRYRGKIDLIRVFLHLFYYFLKNKPLIVHAHLFDASLIAMAAARMSGVKKRIYTRHHATLHHENYPHAVKYDKLINILSTDIIAVSEIIKQVLIERENVSPAKIHVIHHGFNFNEMDVKSFDKAVIRQKYVLDNHYPIVGVVSRFIEWKGVHYIIPAFKKLLIDYPNAKLVLANASGELKEEIVNMLTSLPPNSFVLIDFEQEIFALMQNFDMFIHVPIGINWEAFGQTYIEAMNAKIPVICTIAGIAAFYVVDHQNALIVNYRDSNSIYNNMLELLGNEHLKTELIERAFQDVRTYFSIDKMIKNLEEVYG